MGWIYHNKPPMGWPLDWDNHINDGLAGYWLFNEGSGGQVFDLSGNGNTWIFGTGAASPTWESGKFGSWLYFDGGDYIIIPSTVLNTTTGFSVSFWFQKTAGEGNYGVLGSTTQAGYKRLIFLDGGNLHFETDTDGDVASGAPITHDTLLHHYVITGIGGTIAMYEDGRALTMSDSSVVDNCTIDQIGVNKGSFYAIGNLDNFIFYNRALTASEITLHRREPFCGFMNPDEIPVLDQYYTVGGISILRRRRECA